MLGSPSAARRVTLPVPPAPPPSTRQRVPRAQAHGQDLVEQLVVGLGWRVTGEHQGGGTRSLAVASAAAGDCRIVKMVVTAPEPELGPGAEGAAAPAAAGDSAVPAHFHASNLDRFAEAHKVK